MRMEKKSCGGGRGEVSFVLEVCLLVEGMGGGSRRERDALGDREGPGWVSTA